MKLQRRTQHSGQVALVVLTRTPDDPSAKSRLRSQGVPSCRVSDLHRAMVFDTLELVENISCDRKRISWLNEVPSNAHALVSTAEHTIQEGNSLPERIEYELSSLLEEGFHVVLIGSDCPLLTATHLQQARAALMEGKIVLGPSPEGGFYLLAVPSSQSASGLHTIFAEGSEIEGLLRFFDQKDFLTLPFLTDIDLMEDAITVRGILACHEASGTPKQLRTYEVLRQAKITIASGETRRKLMDWD
jgi:glycosyltransferase A (GT-A) superfamily protein (DUF2064 family)